MVANVLESGGAASVAKAAPTDLEKAYDFISTFVYGEIRPAPFQVRSEFQQLLSVLRDDKPERVLEIGTAQGGTLFLLTRAAASSATIVTVDLPGGAFGGGYRRSQSLFLKAFARKGQKIHLIRRDSHALATREEVARYVQQIDFLFIDGDHSYEGVRQDWEMYSPLVRSGGLVAFHDIVQGRAEDVGGVPQFWAELRAAHPEAREFIENPKQGGAGIGVIRRRA